MPCRGTNKGEHLWLAQRWAKNGQPGILARSDRLRTHGGHQINMKQTNIHMGNGEVVRIQNTVMCMNPQTHGHTADMKSMCLVDHQIAEK